MCVYIELVLAGSGYGMSINVQQDATIHRLFYL